MRLLAIDPGPTQSAWVLLDRNRVVECDILPNDGAASLVSAYAENRDYKVDHLAVEMIQSFGMAVGADVFETVFWIGRFIEAWDIYRCGDWSRVYRKEVKMHLCGNMRAKDPNIRQALLDKYGGRPRAIGSKSMKGPLYGVRKDIWSALAVGITWIETRADDQAPRT